MKRRLLTACLILIVLLAACAPVGSTSTPGAPAGTTPASAPVSTVPAAAPTSQPTTAATAAPSPAAAAPVPAAAAAASTAAPASTTAVGAAGATAGPTAGATGIPAGDFQNPVLQSDFPDPDVIRVGDTFYAYATASGGKNIQVARSTDAVHWEILPDALPVLGPWDVLGGSAIWAPGVIQLGNRFVMYYTGHDPKSDKQCIGVATSDKPEGKFTDTGDHPFICQPDQGGSIDPDVFQDGNKLYLYWKNDGNSMALPTNLYVQELSSDGLSLVGEPKVLTDNSEVWEGPVVEAPLMVKHADKYYLFFSANVYNTLKYSVGYATCDSPTGPCRQAAENPVLQTRLQPPPVFGPGGESLLDIGGQTWIFYHAWNNADGVPGTVRYMYLDRVDWQDGKPVVKGPTTSPEPEPDVKP